MLTRKLTTKLQPVKAIDLKEFMIKWNMAYPFDRWWRLKHGIPFGSKKHKKANFIDMIVELREDLYFKQLKEKPDEDLEFTDEEKLEYGHMPDDGTKKVIKMSNKEIDKEFAELDLSQFNTPE
jgi:hypothetical protein